MKLKVKFLEFAAGRPVAILNEHTAERINVHVDERIKISKKSNSIISVVDIATGSMKENEIGVSEEIVKSLKLRKGSLVEVLLAQDPESSGLIKKKLRCNPLSGEEIKIIIKDIVDNALTETEIAYFVSSVYKCGMNPKETEDLVRAMVNVGKTLKFNKGNVVDKHSIGGIAGNRTTPLIVSICAAAGLIMPKTSSRAITSAAGTADVIESIAPVEFELKEIKKIIKKTNACMVWGGSLGLSPADDKLIQVERILHLDPEPQLLASVLSKKISVGSEYVLIDLPYGPSAKVSKLKAKRLKANFEKLGKKFGLKLKAVLTDGKEPIGHGIGPLLEIRDIVLVLARNVRAPKDLERKSLFLAGQIFELCGKTKKGKGEKLAKQILNSGEAFKKFLEIINAQGGKVPNKFTFAKLEHNFKATKNGVINSIDNKKISLLAMVAGSPMNKKAGLYLPHHIGHKIRKGDIILTAYTDSETRLKDLKKIYKNTIPITLK